MTSDEREEADRMVFISAATGVWGAEESLLTLAQSIDRAGHSVGLVCIDEELAQIWSVRVNACVVLVRPSELERASRVRLSRRLWREYHSISGSRDVVVLFTYYLVMHSLTERLFRRRRVFLDLHDQLNGRRGELLLNASLLGCAGVIAVSTFTGSQVRVLKPKVLTRPISMNGFASPDEYDETPAQLASPPYTETSPYVVGIVGRLVDGKGHELVFSAMKCVGPDILLRVRGGGDGSSADISAYVERAARESGDRIALDGRVTQRDAMRGLHALVVANSREPMGRTVLEAQLSGVIAVVPDEGGSSELVVPGRTGLVYRADDASSLAAAIMTARDMSSADLESIVREARARAVDVVDPALYASRYWDLCFPPDRNARKGHSGETS